MSSERPSIPRSNGTFFRRVLHSGYMPDPGGWISFGVVLGVIASHLVAGGPAAGCLFSRDLWLEVLGHLWLLFGPPLALYLGLRHLLLRGDSLLPLLTVPLAFFLTVITGAGVILGVFSRGA